MSLRRAKRLALATFLLLIAGESLSGQSLQHEINEQVWKPFIATFNELDSDGFLAVHSQDLIRAARDGKEILNWAQYLEQQRKGDKRTRDEGSKRIIELRFTERIANTTQAIDVGVYKTTNIKKDGSTQSYFGRFHVAMRKENGTWKILVDTDSSEGGTISEKEFLAAKPM
jgi:ketosteroid isomerase-like protein